MTKKEIFICVLAIAVLAVIAFTVIWLQEKLKQKKAKRLGEKGESAVQKILSKLAKNGGGMVLNDVVLKDGKGKTHQLDHVYVNRSGVWVIETKNHKGAIYGDDFRKTWTQVLGNQRHSLYSPLRQNEGHVRAVQEVIGLDTPVFPIVVFVKADTRHVQSDGVCSLQELPDKIARYTGANLSLNSQLFYFEQIRMAVEESRVTSREHAKDMAKRNKRICRGKCPLCEGKLVKRNGKRGKFYGCSNFPRCRFTCNKKR